MRRRSSTPNVFEPTSDGGRRQTESHSLSSSLRRRSSTSFLPWNASSGTAPPSPTSSVSSTASAIDDPPARGRPFHIHDSSHPKWVTKPLHDLEMNLEKTRKAMEESQAEEVFTLPDASEAMRMRPIIEGAKRKIQFGTKSEMKLVAAAGDLVAVAWGVRVEVYSLTQDKIAWCEVGFHGVIGYDCVSAMAWSESGRYLWVGTKEGSMYEFDSDEMYHSSRPSYFNAPALRLVAHRHDAHPREEILLIRHVDSKMYTIDVSGRIVVWLPSPKAGELCSIRGHSKVLQIPTRPVWLEVIDGLVYVSYRYKLGERTRGSTSTLAIYDVSTSRAVLVGEYEWNETGPGEPGRVTCACVVPSHRQFVLVGHSSGHVSVWDPSSAKLIDVRKLCLSSITTMAGPSRFLWVGRADGLLDVLDIGDPRCWRVIKRWHAHDGPIETLIVDPRSLWTASQLRVLSAGDDGYVRFWDGLLRKDWITLEMQKRVNDFCSFSPLRIGIFSWNIDGVRPEDFEAASPVNQTLLGNFLKSVDDPDIISFNFQELVDLSDLTLAARTFLLATKHHDVTLRYKHWRSLLFEAVVQRLGPEWDLVKEEKLIGLYTVIFARKNVKARLRDVEGSGIKTGFSGEWGNKGSVLVRLALEDSSICFVNSHLNAGRDGSGRRERDLIEIFDSGPKFTRPTTGTKKAYVGGGDGTQISDAEILFFSGDLNFRIALPRSTVLSTLAKSPTAIYDLLEHDELRTLRQTNASFRLRSLKEAPIRFPPTYKYDHNSTHYDTSEKQRTPAWCDRILWKSQLRDESVECLAYGRYEADISDHRPISASFEVQSKRRNAMREEAVLRTVLHEWAIEEEKLLDAARSFYPASW